MIHLKKPNKKSDWEHISKTNWNKILAEDNKIKKNFNPRNNYLQDGKKFITNFKPFFIYDEGKRKFLIDFSKTYFESPIGLSVKLPEKKLTKEEKIIEDRKQDWEKDNRTIFSIKLGFNENAVIIEAIQGKKGFSGKIKEFEKTVGMPIANYLITEIEKQAKKEGYESVKIIKPQLLKFYHVPQHPTIKTDFNDLQWVKWAKKIRKNMLKIYYTPAKVLGYKPTKDYLFKKL